MELKVDRKGSHYRPSPTTPLGPPRSLLPLKNLYSTAGIESPQDVERLGQYYIDNCKAYIRVCEGHLSRLKALVDEVECKTMAVRLESLRSLCQRAYDVHKSSSVERFL